MRSISLIAYALSIWLFTLFCIFNTFGLSGVVGYQFSLLIGVWCKPRPLPGGQN